MRRRAVAVLLAGLSLPAAQLLYPGCATMLNGPKQEVRVKSLPRGARVFVDGKEMGRTPVAFHLARWGFHRVRIELDGYEPYEIPLRKGVSPNAAGNLFVGGVPIVIDLLTGAVFELELPAGGRRGREQMPRELWPEYGRENFFANIVTVSTVLKPAPGTRRIGQLKKR
jgi:hypothetical protein